MRLLESIPECPGRGERVLFTDLTRLNGSITTRCVVVILPPIWVWRLFMGQKNKRSFDCVTVAAPRHTSTVPPMSALLTLEDLASRWTVTRRTARAATRREGFPEPLTISARSLRWYEDEVKVWESHGGRKKAPRRKLPRYYGQVLPMPAKVYAA